MKRLHVLVVEDDETLRDLLGEVLRGWGYQTVVVSSGRRGRRASRDPALRGCHPGHPPAGDGRGGAPAAPQAARPLDRGAHDDGGSHRGDRGGDAEAGRLRLPDEAPDPGGAAPPAGPHPGAAAPPPGGQRAAEPARRAAARERARRCLAGHGGGEGHDRPRGAGRLAGADRGRERDGEGAGGGGDPPAVRPRQRTVHHGQLRRGALRSPGVGVLRPRARGVLGSGGRHARPVPLRPRRDDLPRRGGGAAAAAPGEAAPGPPGEGRAPGRVDAELLRRHAGHRRHEQEPRHRDQGREPPAGPLLPPERRPDPRAAAARAKARHRRAGDRVHPPVQPALQPRDQGHRPGRHGGAPRVRLSRQRSGAREPDRAGLRARRPRPDPPRGSAGARRHRRGGAGGGRPAGGRGERAARCRRSPRPSGSSSCGRSRSTGTIAPRPRAPSGFPAERSTGG